MFTYIIDLFNCVLELNNSKSIDKSKNNYFIIDRLLDNDCNGKILSLGINGNSNPNNILGSQCIRIGDDGDINRLISFIKTDNNLVYNFENNVSLVLYKNNLGKIIYSLKMGEDQVIVKEINETIIKMYKPISMASDELDAIVELQ
jgi:hypothetical protein